MIESGAIYEPLAWTPADAHRFLHAVPSFESAGLVVRVPDWWRARRPPRPEVTVRVGEKKASGIGMDALLDFSVAVALGSTKLLWHSTVKGFAPFSEITGGGGVPLTVIVCGQEELLPPSAAVQVMVV